MWSTSSPPRFLVDRCVFTLGQTVRGVQVLESMQWGPSRVDAWASKLQGKRTDYPDWLWNEVKAIASVAAAARAGVVRVHTSIELMAEAMASRPGWSGLTGDLWAGVHFDEIPPALERSRFGALPGEQFSSREHQTQFYEMLLKFAEGGVPPQLFEVVKFDDFELASIKLLPEFAAICAPLQHRSRLCDAFHLWTAMRNHVLFMTIDDKFLAELDLDTRSKAILPSEVVTMLNLPTVELPVAVDELVDLF